MSPRKMSEEEKNRKANERWLLPKKKNNVNFDFNRHSRQKEWCRLYEDESWLNRFKGRRQ